MTNLQHHQKSATTSYNVFLNVIPSTTYDAGELLTLSELLHLKEHLSVSDMEGNNGRHCTWVGGV